MPERSDELAALRRRAYGPDADIHSDRSALDRLHELEALARRVAEPVASPEAARRMVAPPLPEPPEAQAATEPVTQERTAAVTATAELSPRLRWWQRLPLWSVAAGSLAVGIAVGAMGMASTLSNPGPDYTLRALPDDGEREQESNNLLSPWGLDADSVVRFEPFSGLDVSTALSNEGARCILLLRDAEPVWTQCAPDGLDTILDYTVYPGDTLLDETLPVGTVVRFIADGSLIRVWVQSPEVSA